MSPIEKLKSEATTLQEREHAAGRHLKYCAALEQSAKNHGYTSWRACSAILAKIAPAVAIPKKEKAQMSVAEMKRFESSEWNFALDIPTRWNSFPPVPTNSPNEVVRFASGEDGYHLLIIFRMPHDPQKSRQEVSNEVQEVLAKNGFANFTTAKTTIKSKVVLTLDFDKLHGDGIWSCRHYFLAENTLGYTLGFGTTNRTSMFELYDRIAKSFTITAEQLPSSPS